MARIFTPEELTPVCLEMAGHVIERLPKELSGRLRHNVKVRRHGSMGDVLLFNFWDKFQTQVFDPCHFCYCLNYHPLRKPASGKAWQLHLWLNRQRIYHNRAEILAYWERQLEKVCPEEFEFTAAVEGDWAIELKFEFDIEELGELPGLLVDRYVGLIEAVHPALSFIYDTFDDPLPTEERRLIIEGRKKFQPSGQRFRSQDYSLYSRFVSSKDSKLLLAQYENRCGFCGEALKRGDLEFHHIKPRYDGGFSEQSNFVPLHVLCHDEVHRRLGKGQSVVFRPLNVSETAI